jgi:glycosyltransferase involved in cell wall biosynthesis
MITPQRLVFFVQGHKVPAARVRGLVIAEALERAGIPCDLRIPYPSVYGDTRLGYPWSKLTRDVLRPAAAVVQMRNVRQLQPSDAIFIQRPLIEFPVTFLERRLARAHRTVFDFDDAIYLGLGNERKIRRIIDAVELVITGNQYLAEFAAVPDKTTVIPTVVDTDRFARQPTRDRRGRDVVIGWTGLRGNYPQLMTAAGALARVIERTGAQLRVISNGPPPSALAALGARYVPWSPHTEISDLAEIDIGLMPLPDTPFTRGKCAFKLIQYMSLGRPAVASPVGVNCEVVTDGVDGFLAGTQEAWEERLVQLVSDPELRDQIASAARARIESSYSLSAVLPRYLSVLQRLGMRPEKPA